MGARCAYGSPKVVKADTAFDWRCRLPRVPCGGARKFRERIYRSLMNRQFVNVKIDRAERPDLDQINMTALQAMGEQGGSPLTMFLDPHGLPFWGVTYFPPERRYGRPGFPDILNAIHYAWSGQRDDLPENAGKLLTYRRRSDSIEAFDEAPAPSDTTACGEKPLSLHDVIHGGIRGAPDFPNTPLLAAWLRGSRGHPTSVLSHAFPPHDRADEPRRHP